jgi:hypothetical protein
VNHLRQSIEKFPDFFLGHWYLGLACICVSMMEEAVEKSRKRMMELEKRSEKEYVSAGYFIDYYRIKGE